MRREGRLFLAFSLHLTEKFDTSRATNSSSYKSTLPVRTRPDLTGIEALLPWRLRHRCIMVPQAYIEAKYRSKVLSSPSVYYL